MFQIATLKQHRNSLDDFRRKLEAWYYRYREKYRYIFEKKQSMFDIAFISVYLTSSIIDGIVTLSNIGDHTEEAHPFTAFMMESYGVDEGLLRVQGIEALQLAALLGLSYIIVELWRLFKGEEINTEVRFALVYVYITIGISKHIQGILSWL